MKMKVHTWHARPKAVPKVYDAGTIFRGRLTGRLFELTRPAEEGNKTIFLLRHRGKTIRVPGDKLMLFEPVEQ